MVDECGNCYGDCSFNDDGLIVCSENAGIVNSISNPFYVDFLTQCEEYDTGIPCSIIFETAINGDWIQTPDCAGECGGDAVFDECEVCGGDGPAGGVDCDGEPLSLFYGLVPEKFSIHSIYPNPFNPVTSITYGLPEHINVQIIVYDLSGKQVETLTNQLQRPGYHSLNWTAYNLPNGVYIIRMESGDFTQTQKVMLVK